MTDIVLRLYVTGQTPSAARAITAVNAVRADLGAETVSVEVIDVLDDPVAALQDDVYATPTIFRVKPAPVRRLFGDLSSKDAVILGLALQTPER